MSHIRNAQRDREARREAWEAALDADDHRYRADAANEIRRRGREAESQSAVERAEAIRRLFAKWGTPCLALTLLIVGPVIADTAARSIT